MSCCGLYRRRWVEEREKDNIHPPTSSPLLSTASFLASRAVAEGGVLFPLSPPPPPPPLYPSPPPPPPLSSSPSLQNRGRVGSGWVGGWRAARCIEEAVACAVWRGEERRREERRWRRRRRRLTGGRRWWEGDQHQVGARKRRRGCWRREERVRGRREGPPVLGEVGGWVGWEWEDRGVGGWVGWRRRRRFE